MTTFAVSSTAAAAGSGFNDTGRQPIDAAAAAAAQLRPRTLALACYALIVCLVVAVALLAGACAAGCRRRRRLQRRRRRMRQRGSRRQGRKGSSSELLLGESDDQPDSDSDSDSDSESSISCRDAENAVACATGDNGGITRQTTGAEAESIVEDSEDDRDDEPPGADAEQRLGTQSLHRHEQCCRGCGATAASATTGSDSSSSAESDAESRVSSWHRWAVVVPRKRRCICSQIPTVSLAECRQGELGGGWRRHRPEAEVHVDAAENSADAIGFI